METLHNNRWKFICPVSGFDPTDPNRKGWLFSTYRIDGGTSGYKVSYHIAEEVRFVDQRNRLIKYFNNLNENNVMSERDGSCLCVKEESVINA